MFAKIASSLAIVSVFALPQIALADPDIPAMLSHCEKAASHRLGVRISDTTVKSEGQRTDGTNVINGTIGGDDNQRFQCSFNKSGDRLANFWTNVAPAAHSQSQVKTLRIRFAHGSSGTEFTDTIRGAHTTRYLLGARNGQFLYARVVSDYPHLHYVIRNPDGSELYNSRHSKDEYRGQLFETGDHVLEVINTGHSSANVRIVVSID